MADGYNELIDGKTQKEVRFGLRTLLQLPLFFSPLLMSLAVASDLWARRQAELGSSVIFYAVCYTLMLLIWWCARVKRQLPHTNFRVLRCVKIGVIVGSLFGIQLLLPVQTSEIIRVWYSYDGSFNLWGTTRVLLGRFSVDLGHATLVFALIGAVTGGLFGLCLKNLIAVGWVSR